MFVLLTKIRYFSWKIGQTFKKISKRHRAIRALTKRRKTGATQFLVSSVEQKQKNAILQIFDDLMFHHRY